MIKASKLCKNFGAVKAVQEVSFTVNRGEVVGFLGPNGAGKTTTFRMIAGSIGPSSGHVTLCGVDLERDPLRAKRSIGYMPENAPLYPELTGGEYLSYRAELKGVARKERSEEVKRCAKKALVSQMLTTRIAHLSKGYRQRMALADALLGAPPILLLDEPTSGLDPNQVQEVRKLIGELSKDHAVLLSTHVLSEVEATCSRAIVINQGRIVASGALAELQNQRKAPRGRIVLETASLSHSTEELRAALSAHVADLELNSRGKTVTLEFGLNDPGTLSSVLAPLCELQAQILEAGPVTAPLDDVFARLTLGAKETHS